jgi:hypothetical protein
VLKKGLFAKDRLSLLPLLCLAQASSAPRLPPSRANDVRFRRRESSTRYDQRDGGTSDRAHHRHCSFLSPRFNPAQPTLLSSRSQCTQAQRISTNRGKIKVDDFKFALRKDPKKLARVDELLFMTEVISRARGKEDFTQYADESDLAKKGTTGGGVGGGSGTATAAAGDGGASKKSKGKGKAKG